MKVLHIVSVSFSIKYFIGNQFNYFGKRGFTFSVACSESVELYELSKKYNFDTFAIPIVRNIAPIQDLVSGIKLYRFIRRNKFDVVIAHSPKGGLIGMLASFLARSPRRVFFRHGLVFETSKGIKKRLLIWIEQITASCAHKVVNVSPSVQSKADAFRLNRKSKNVILGKGTCNGVDTDRFSPRKDKCSSKKTIFGFVGRLSNDKGIAELVEAWKILLSKYRDIELLLIGPMDERDGIGSETVNVIKLLESIRWVGAVDDTSQYYQEMDVFILPSYREGFPTVVLEASASQVPVITTRSTGCIDSIIENETGIFTELFPYDIAKNMEYYLLNPDVAKRHGENGRRFVLENFAEDYVYSEIEIKLLS